MLTQKRESIGASETVVLWRLVKVTVQKCTDPAWPEEELNKH